MTERTGQTPDPADPADPEGLRHAVNQQRAFLELHSNAISRMSKIQEDLLSRLNGIMQKLTDLPGQMSNSVTTATLPTSGNTSTNPPVPTPKNFRLQPEPFYGDVEACSGFLLQCQLLFHQAPRYYSSDPSKITLIVNSLRNKALQWAQAFLAANPITHLPFERFINEFCLVFDQPKKKEEATRKLLALRQHNRSVRDHVIDFRILAVEACWSDPALHGFSVSPRPAPYPLIDPTTAPSSY
uniref:Retrotransposon gag domain-containing protein n=1 Tax=Oryzias sinensis TaxID=183150 RepID=A0A8C7Z746_9TELE